MLSDPCSGAFTRGDFVIRENADPACAELLHVAPKMGDAIM